MAKTFSIIIPLHRDGKHFRECLDGCLNLDYNNYEILIASDRKVKLPKNKKIRFFLTGSQTDTSPAEKRDAALKYAKGRILAFIDDDAYPEKNWLKKAEMIFNEKNAAGIGGPGLTPQSDNFWQKLGGAFYESWFGSGRIRHRFIRKKEMEDYDLPAYNLFIRREVLNEIGGWGSKYYGGEDTKVCLEMKKRGYKLLYTPEIIAWHHRRPFPIKHLKQIGNVGRQRGMFARKYPETSRKLFYFLPSIGSLLFLAFLLISLFNGNVASVFLKILALCYLLIFSVSLIERKNLLISLSLPFVIFFSHLIYGLRFLKGFLFMKNEKD